MDNQFQNKLLQFEVQPPSAAWQRLAEALDENTLGEIGNRLSRFEVLPNHNTWNNINNQLDEATPAKVIPIYKKYATHLKYGTAVAVFAAVALIANLLISSKPDPATQGPSTVKNILTTTPDPQDRDNTSEIPVSADRNVEANEGTPHNSNSKNISITRRRPSQFTPTLASITTPANNVAPQYAKRSTVITFVDSERYMAYKMDDGSAVKLPKKMYDAITCPTKDVNCMQKIRQLQEKMAASALLPDFTGMLDMVNNLGENQ